MFLLWPGFASNPILVAGESVNICTDYINRSICIWAVQVVVGKWHAPALIVWITCLSSRWLIVGVSRGSFLLVSFIF